MSRKNLLLTLCCGWDIMLLKKLVDTYIIKMMLIILDERWKAGLFPPGVWFHLIHLGPEFRVLCFLMSVPDRVWGSMGLPCLTCLASYILVVARADLLLQSVCVGWYTSCSQNNTASGDMV